MQRDIGTESEIRSKTIIAEYGENIRHPNPGEGWKLSSIAPVEGEPNKARYVFIQYVDADGNTLLTQ